MEEARVPRYRGAVKASLGVLAVLLVCQAAFPITQVSEERRPAVPGGPAAAENGGRRLNWWTNWRGPKDAGDNGGGNGGGNGGVGGDGRRDGQESSGWGGRGAKGVEEGAAMANRLPRGGEKHTLRPGGGGGGGGGGDFAGAARLQRPKRPKTPDVPVSDVVDLSTEEEGRLWLPVSMTAALCSGAGEHDCDADVRFCLLDIAEYQEAPWKYPMSAMLQKHSECNKKENLRAFRISSLRVYLRDHADDFLEPHGFVYHETRTGSTLVANMLAHVPSNLVASENNVAEDPARHCADCTDAQRISMLRVTLRLLGNRRNGHEHLFFKFQDATTLNLMTQAFPDVGWVYLFRDPVEVMVSNLKTNEHRAELKMSIGATVDGDVMMNDGSAGPPPTSSAACLPDLGAYGKRNRFYDFDAADNTTANHDGGTPNAKLAKLAKPSKPLMSPCLMSVAAEMKGRPREEICAVRLKTLCQAAVDQMEGGLHPDGMGAVVEYTNLPDVMTEYIYPTLFAMGNDKLQEHLPHLSEAARMYSKSMSNPESEFAQGTDAHYKQVMAEQAYQEAADSTGLSAVYGRLQGLQTWHKKEGDGAERSKRRR